MRRLRQLIKKPTVRILPLFFVAVFFLTTISATISALLPTDSVSAQTPNDPTTTATDPAASCASSGGVYIYVGSSMTCEPGSSSYAIPKTDVTTQPGWTDQDTVMSALYERALLACLVSSGAINSNPSDTTSRVISVTDASDLSEWSDSGHGIIVTGSGSDVRSALLDPSDDGVLSCNNENQWIQNALTLWHIDTKIEALCILGWYRYDSSKNSVASSPGTYDNCVNGSGDLLFDAYVNQKTGKVSSTIPDVGTVVARLAQARGISPTLDKAHTYLLYKYIFEQSKAGCGATQVVEYNKANADQKALLGTDKAVEVTIVDGTGTKAAETKYIYEFEDGTTETSTKEVASYLNGYFLYKASPGTDGANQCDYIKDAMNALADDYLAAVQSAKIDNNAANKAPGCTTGGTGCTQTGTTCAVGGVGWIVCPIYNLLAGISDATYGIISGLLNVPTTIFDTDSGTYTGWLIARNIANIGFVIIFLIIIFSQVSSLGVSNYGVKKMLPRLIVAAILVNASYFVCELAVDISNILGNSIHDFLINIPIFKNAHDFWSGNNPVQSVVSQILDGSIVLGLGVAAGAVAVFAGVGLILPVLLGVILAVVVTFLILVGREAMVILLVVVAPLAFLAMLLPNTENLFKQWRKFFTAMLILYPTVALLYGGSRLAGGILLDALGGQGLAQIAAAAVGIIPLVATPFLLRGSLNAIPILGNVASKMQSRANGLVGRKSKELYNSTPFARGRAIRKQARDNYRTEKFAKSVDKGGLGRLMASGFGVTKAGKLGNEALARNAAGILNEAEEKEIRNSDARLGNMRVGPEGKETPLTTKQLMQIYKGEHVTDDKGNILRNKSEFKEYDRIAAVQRAASVANVGEANEMLDATRDPEMSATVRKFAAKALGTAPVTSKAPWLGGKTVAEAEQTGITASEATLKAIIDGKLSASALAGGDDASSQHLVDTVTDQAGDTAEVLQTKANARAMLKAEAEKVYAAGSHLSESVTSGSKKEGSLQNMRGF